MYWYKASKFKRRISYNISTYDVYPFTTDGSFDQMAQFK